MPDFEFQQDIMKWWISFQIIFCLIKQWDK